MPHSYISMANPSHEVQQLSEAHSEVQNLYVEDGMNEYSLIHVI